MNIETAAQSAINERTYLKNPVNGELGQKIVRGGLEMMESSGFEHFTFKKLAEKIGTTEASIYRYFESKHKLLIYLTSWYWSIIESSKAYLTREVDNENRDGAYAGYKRVVAMVSDLVVECRPNYRYPRMLISSVIEAAHHQRFFADHLPRLTDTVPGADCIKDFCNDIVFKSIQSKEK
jgi:AcrR family transcriptional regulator